MVISSAGFGLNCHEDQQQVAMEIRRLLWRSAAWFTSHHVFSEQERKLEALEQEVTNAFTGRNAGAERQQKDVPEKCTTNQVS